MPMTGNKPSLLIHACCAPCSSAVLERLSDSFEIALYFYNPNIYPREEYDRRLSELRRLCGIAGGEQPVIAEAAYNAEEFYRATGARDDAALQKEGECGERCRRCYLFRMKKTCEYAAAQAFDFWTTTLSVSPHKDARMINAIGGQLDAENAGKTQYLWADFKKKDGYKRSLELSKKFGLYRQSYCGCEFSLYNRKNGKFNPS
ncbi:MAG: epoxyqueuosine reductase QueH [Treponemataceae bacterium]|nr:MAG: epoxyqueuosine reductase QueH [Treponemataceae bacterium]